MLKPIAIIDCAIEGPSYNCMNKIVHAHKVPFTYHWISHYGTESLDFVQEPCAYIIFGSHSNVCDKLKWQVELAKKMKDAIQRNIPVLGICFGHQLMADAFGGRVDLITEDKVELEGIREYEILTDHLGFKKGDTYTNFISHSYEVKEIPKDFIHLGTSKDCRYEALAHKDYNYISFQGHPEASSNFVNEHFDDSISSEQLKSGLDGGHSIITKFIELVKEVSH